MAQDLVRSSLDGENPLATEVDVDFPFSFHRTSWVSQHRANCCEVVKHRGCLSEQCSMGKPGWALGGWGVECQEVPGSMESGL